MGFFDLPSGNFELLLSKNGSRKQEWKSVMMTDRLYPEEIADCVEQWSKNYKVRGARHNGREVNIPTSYHWELRAKSDVIGSYPTREAAKEAADKRRMQNWGKRDEERIPIGAICFVQD